MSVEGTSSNSDDPTNARWIIFTLGCGTSWMLYLHRYTFALIKPQLQEEMHLDKVQLGMLDSAFTICYSVFQFPAGIIADVSGAHIFLGSIILLWSLGLAMHAWATDLNTMWYARAVFGAGQAGAFASINRITRTWFPFSVRTSVQGWMGIFFGRIGGLSANILFATVLLGMLKFEWRTAIYILAAVGILHGILFLLLFRDSPRRHPWANKAEADLIEEIQTTTAEPAQQDESTEKSQPKQRMTIRQMFGRMSSRSICNVMFLNVQSILSTVADNIYSAWIPLFLYDVHHLKFKEMGIYSALPLLGGALGGAIGGFLNDYLIRKTGNRRWARSGVGLFGKTAAGALIFLAMFWYDNPYLFCTVLFFVKLFGDWSLASSWGTVTDIGGKATASVYAFNNSIAGAGAFIAPIMYGFVADKYGWKPVFYIAGTAYFLCAASWLLVNCTVPILREETVDSDSDRNDGKADFS